MRTSEMSGPASSSTQGMQNLLAGLGTYRQLPEVFSVFGVPCCLVLNMHKRIPQGLFLVKVTKMASIACSHLASACVTAYITQQRSLTCVSAHKVWPQPV